MLCMLCKENEAKNFDKTNFGICDKCYIEIVNSFHYFVGDKEITREEYKKEINNG